MNTKVPASKGCQLDTSLAVVGMRRQRSSALTRVDALCFLATLFILAALALPLLANTKPRAERVTCVNNLRQIGQAVSSWASAHNNENPWWVPASSEGLKPNSGSVVLNAWMVYLFLQQNVASPNVLVCPSDTKLLAKDFSTSPNGGLMHPLYRDNAISYFVGLHSFFDEPRSLLSGDRNIRGASGPFSCSAGINNASKLVPNDPQVQWENSIHQRTGNLLFNSGAVEQLSNQGLSDALSFQTNSRYPTEVHLLIP